MAGSTKSRSLRRTVVSASPFSRARRSAAEIRHSSAARVMRTDTPDFWSTYSLWRASKAICSMISRKK